MPPPALDLRICTADGSLDCSPRGLPASPPSLLGLSLAESDQAACPPTPAFSEHIGVVVRHLHEDSYLFPSGDATLGDLRKLIGKVRMVDDRPGGFDVLLHGEVLSDDDETLAHLGVELGDVFEIGIGPRGRARQRLRDEFNLIDTPEGLERKLIDLCKSSGDTFSSPSGRRVSLEMMRLLLEAGADPNCKEYPQIGLRTPRPALHPHLNAAETSLRSNPLGSEGDGATLSPRVAEVSPPHSPASPAAQRRTHGMDVNSNVYVVPMESSVASQSVSMVDPGTGYRPIHFAAANNDVDALRLLREHGAHSGAADHRGNTAMHDAVREGSEEAMRYLKEWGVELRLENRETYAHLAVVSENTEALRLLLEWGVSPDCRDASGATPMHLAVDSQRTSGMSVLREWNASVDLVDNNGWTPMHFAVCDDNTAAMRTLREWGADHEVTDSEKRSLMHIACAQHSVGAMCLLKDWGADVNAKDINGRTPLHAAAKAGWQTPIELLIEWGADLHISDNAGRCPTDLCPVQSDGAEVLKRRSTLSITLLVAIAVLVPLAVMFAVLAVLYLI